MTRRTVFLAALVLALAGVAVWRLRVRPPTDEDQIRALFDDAARAAEEKRVDDAVRGISERFEGEGLDRRRLRRLVLFEVLRGEWVSVSVAGAHIRVEGDQALANVDLVLARATGQGKKLAAILPGEATARRLKCRLEREAAGWRVVEASGQEVTIPDVIAGPPEP